MNDMQSEDQTNHINLEQQTNKINNLLAEDKAIARKVAEVNVDRAWHKILLRKRSNMFRLTVQRWLPYAAAIIFVFYVGYYFAVYNEGPGKSNSYTVFNIPNSEMGNVVLPDGTRVELNSMSELKYPVHFLKSREVFLNGEAFFDVVANPKNPFLVHVDDFTIKVTGTKFNIKSYPNTNPEATLEEGKITVLNNEGNSIIELEPNENLVYDKVQKRIFVATIDTHQKTDWRKGRISFKNKTIEEMAKIIERWYNVKIEFENEAIKQVRLTGTILKNKPVEQLLKVFKKSEPVDFEFYTEPEGRGVIKIKYEK